METALGTATVEVSGQRFTGSVYHVRENGWLCVETESGHIASGPEIPTCHHTGWIGFDNCPHCAKTLTSR